MWQLFSGVNNWISSSDRLTKQFPQLRLGVDDGSSHVLCIGKPGYVSFVRFVRTRKGDVRSCKVTPVDIIARDMNLIKPDVLANIVTGRDG